MARGQADERVAGRGTTFYVATCRVFHITSPTHAGPVKSTQLKAFAGGDNYGNYTINISDSVT
jgi:hypothetical protein